MLKVCRIAALVVGGLFAHAALAGSVVAGQAPAGKGDVLRALAGFWKAQEYKVNINSDLDVSVWGPGASKVRSVELALESSGTGVLRVRSSVVDSRGRTKPYSASVIEARLQVQEPAVSAAGVVEPQVTVVSAEERYLDGSAERRTIDGLTIRIHAMSPTSNEINFRYDTAQGNGSFGETLIRRAKTAGKGSASGSAGTSSGA
jgi:hypothetical protein